MTSHIFDGLLFTNSGGTLSGLSAARALVSAEERVAAFTFYEANGDTYYDATGLGVRVQVATPPDPLGNRDWLAVQGFGGYGFTSDDFRAQRITWGDGNSAIVLTVELGYSGQSNVLLIRLRGDLLPDADDPVAADEFLSTLQNTPALDGGLDLSEPVPFASVQNHQSAGGNDLFTPAGFGDAWDDGVKAGAGNDTVYGTVDNDTLWGQRGNDLLEGHWGSNRLYGGAGDDTLKGGDGASYTGGTVTLGGDTLYGGSGDDVMLGGANSDTLYGGLGHDRLTGGGGGIWDALSDDGGDRLSGGGGKDTLDGGAGRDALFGGGGRDRLVGGSDSDTMTGGSGRDVFVFSETSGIDLVTDFVIGVDVLDLTGIASAITVLDRAGDAVISWGGGSVVLDGLTQQQVLDAGLV